MRNSTRTIFTKLGNLKVVVGKMDRHIVFGVLVDFRSNIRERT